MSKTRTTIVGAGAVGGLIAAALTKGGHHVPVVARTRTLEALPANGLRIRPAEGENEGRIDVDATSDATTPGAQDFVVIALKAQGLPALAHTLEPLIGPDTAIVA